MAIIESRSGNPVLAALLSFILPGLGQVYSKQVLKGVLWFIAAVVLWPVLLGWIIHILSSIMAYRYAARNL